MAVREQGTKAITSCTSFWRRAVRNSIGAAKHGYDALNMRNVFRKIPRREHDVAEEGLAVEKSYKTSFSVHHCTVAPPTPSAGGRGVTHGKVKGDGKQLEVRSQRPDSCETGGKFLPQRGDDTNTSVRLHVIRYTSSKAMKVL